MEFPGKLISFNPTVSFDYLLFKFYKISCEYILANLLNIEIGTGSVWNIEDKYRHSPACEPRQNRYASLKGMVYSSIK